MQELQEIGVAVSPSEWPQPQPPPLPPPSRRRSLSDLPPSMALPPNHTLVPPISFRLEPLATPPPDSPPSPPAVATKQIHLPVIAAISAAILLALVCMAVAHRVWARRALRRPPAKHTCPYSEADHDVTDHDVADLVSHPVCSHRAMPVSAMNPAYEYVLPSHLALVSQQTSTPMDVAEKLHTYPAPQCSSRRFYPADCVAGQPLASSPRPRRLPADLDSMLPLPPAASAASPSASAGAFHTESASAVSLSGMAALYAATGAAGSHTAPMRRPPSLPHMPSLAAHTHEMSPGSTVIAAPYPVYTPEPGSTRTTATFQSKTVDLQQAADGGGGAQSSHVGPSADVSAVGMAAEWVTRATTEADRPVGGEPMPATTAAAEQRSCSTEQFRRVERQLNAFCVEDQFLGRFIMLGREQRRRGGELLAADREAVCRVRAYRRWLVWVKRVCFAGQPGTGFPGKLVPQ